MCGRYALIQTNELAERFELDPAETDEMQRSLKPRYNVAPEQFMPTVIEQSGDRHLEIMLWGFMPPWASTPHDIYKYNTFNARSESIFDKPLWKRSALTRRCLVPASGFYEWRQTLYGKQPFFIRVKQRDLFAMAGIYRYWKDTDGNEVGTYAIITTAANEVMRPIHDRMPVILEPDAEALWLDPEVPAGVLDEVMAPYPYQGLELYPVSKAVNTSRTDTARLVEPINSK